MNAGHPELPCPAMGGAMKLYGRDSVAVADDLHVSPGDPASELVAGERLERRFLGGEPDRRVLRGQGLIPYVASLGLREQPSIHAVAERLDHVLDAIDLDEVESQPDDHSRSMVGSMATHARSAASNTC